MTSRDRENRKYTIFIPSISYSDVNRLKIMEMFLNSEIFREKLTINLSQQKEYFHGTKRNNFGSKWKHWREPLKREKEEKSRLSVREILRLSLICQGVFLGSKSLQKYEDNYNFFKRMKLFSDIYSKLTFFRPNNINRDLKSENSSSNEKIEPSQCDFGLDLEKISQIDYFLCAKSSHKILLNNLHDNKSEEDFIPYSDIAHLLIKSGFNVNYSTILY